MTTLQYLTPTPLASSLPDELDPSQLSIPIFYRGVGHVMEASLGNGVYFWMIMNNAVITSFGESVGSFGDPARQDIYTATSGVAVADLYVVLNSAAPTGMDVFQLLMSGDDTLIGSDLGDNLLAGFGSDTLTGGLGADNFELYAGNHVVTDLGAGGADSFLVHDQANVTFLAAADWAAGSTTLNQGSATIVTNGFAIDMRNAATTDGNGFTITSAAESIGLTSYGSEGADTLIGGSGNDFLYGQGNDDILIGGLGNDLLDGQAGTNTVSFDGAALAVRVNLSILGAQKTGYGFDTFVSIQNAIGGSASDKLTGNVADNMLDGGAGNDTLVGDAGNDHLVGGLGNDSLNGGNGDDFLFGGAGKDRMTGGLGADTFSFTELTDSVAGAGRDVILNFKAAEGDVLDFRDMNSPHGFNYAGATAFTGEAGELIYKNGMLSADVNGDKVADFQISVVLTDPWHSILT